MNDREALKRVAKDVRKQLLPPPKGIRLRPQLTLKDSYTKGWRVELAGMVAGKPRLELWFDHWGDRNKRRFWYGFFSRKPSHIKALTKNLPAHLQPKRTFKDKDMENSGADCVLRAPLRRNEFGPTYDEYYKEDGTAFFGKFEYASPHMPNSIVGIARQATAFFRDVLEHQKANKTGGDSSDEEVYPRMERKIVRQHLRRERNRSLAEHCKKRDNYKCQVCGFIFETRYGRIGHAFAEAHHVIPLRRLAKAVITLPAHLITVCSNCHRMLHRMEGRSGDVVKLKRMINRPQM